MLGPVTLEIVVWILAAGLGVVTILLIAALVLLCVILNKVQAKKPNSQEAIIGLPHSQVPEAQLAVSVSEEDHSTDEVSSDPRPSVPTGKGSQPSPSAQVQRCEARVAPTSIKAKPEVAPRRRIHSTQSEMSTLPKSPDSAEMTRIRSYTPEPDSAAGKLSENTRLTQSCCESPIGDSKMPSIIEGNQGLIQYINQCLNGKQGSTGEPESEKDGPYCVVDLRTGQVLVPTVRESVVDDTYSEIAL